MALKQRGDGTRVRAGDMDHQLNIQQPTQVTDGQGGRTGTFSTVDTVWGNLIPLTANRAQAYGITMNDKPHEIDLRWESEKYTITEDDRLQIVETGQILYVHSVLNVDKRYERMKILAMEKR